MYRNNDTFGSVHRPCDGTDERNAINDQRNGQHTFNVYIPEQKHWSSPLWCKCPQLPVTVFPISRATSHFCHYWGVSDRDMHHGTCVTHVPWWMSGSLTSSFLWSRWQGKRSWHSRCMRNPDFTYLAIGPWWNPLIMSSYLAYFCWHSRSWNGHEPLYIWRWAIWSIFTRDMSDIWLT